MTNIDEFYHKECDKIDANCIDAYLELELDEDDPSKLIIKSPWSQDDDGEYLWLDLTPAIKDGETVTHMYLSPEDTPVALAFDTEDGTQDCINGEDLSRIIYLTKLADVDQTATWEPGDTVYYDGVKFVTFNLGTLNSTVNDYIASNNQAINVINGRLTTLEGVVQRLSDAITALTNRIEALEALTTPPTGAPAGVKIAFGNINVYGDSSNTNLKTSGIYTHNPNTDIINDEMFA